MDCSDAKRRTLLGTTGDELSTDELSLMKFLFHGVVPDGKLQKCKTGSALLLAIAKHGNDEHIIEGLARAGRKDLASRYSEGCSHEGEPLVKKILDNLADLKETCLSEFRVILVCIADELTDGEDLQHLKSVTTDIPKRALGKANTILDFLSLLMKETKLEPHTLDSALLEPLQHLGITNWVKKHAGKISDFKERLVLRAAEEREGSRSSPITENASEEAESQDSQSSVDGNESQEQSLENEQEVAEAEHSQNKEEEKEIPEQSSENLTPKAEVEDSKDCGETKERQEESPDKEKNEPESEIADTEEERGCRADPDEEDIAEDAAHENASGNKEERAYTGLAYINVTEFIDSKHKISSWPIRPSRKVPGRASKQYTVYRRVEDVRIEEYRMTAKPRGKAVIINNEKFRNCPTNERITNRTGSSVDADGLENLFRSLHFDVERFDDFSFIEIDGRFRNLGEETDHENADCIAIFILTHGKNGQLLDANGRLFDLAQLRKYFYASNCKTLAGKPKMFFIQACQGPVYQGSYNHLETDVATVKTSSTSPQVSSTPPKGKQSPDEADFLICNSTPPGYVSYRDMQKGSWFISTFIETLERDGNCFDLFEILTRTNLVLGDKTGAIDGVACAQIACITTTLRKKVFLRTIPSN